MHEVRGGRADRRHSGYTGSIDEHPFVAATREAKYVSSENLAAITAEAKGASNTPRDK